MALHPSPFLHESHNHSAGHLPVPLVLILVVILLVQLQPILRVRPERVCNTEYTYIYFVHFQCTNLALAVNYFPPKDHYSSCS